MPAQHRSNHCHTHTGREGPRASNKEIARCRLMRPRTAPCQGVISHQISRDSPGSLFFTLPCCARKHDNNIGASSKCVHARVTNHEGVKMCWSSIAANNASTPPTRVFAAGRSQREHPCSRAAQQVPGDHSTSIAHGAKADVTLLLI